MEKEGKLEERKEKRRKIIKNEYGGYDLQFRQRWAKVRFSVVPGWGLVRREENSDLSSLGKRGSGVGFSPTYCWLQEVQNKR